MSLWQVRRRRHRGDLDVHCPLPVLPLTLPLTLSPLASTSVTVNALPAVCNCLQIFLSHFYCTKLYISSRFLQDSSENQHNTFNSLI